MTYWQQEELWKQAPLTWSGRLWGRKWKEQHFFTSLRIVLELDPQE